MAKQDPKADEPTEHLHFRVPASVAQKFHELRGAEPGRPPNLTRMLVLLIERAHDQMKGGSKS